jgi:hypothetical protein
MFTWSPENRLYLSVTNCPYIYLPAKGVGRVTGAGFESLLLCHGFIFETKGRIKSGTKNKGGRPNDAL